MSNQTHTADARVLNRRTLETDHSRLAEVLRRGMSVLDVGCGTGAITAGIARAVGLDGHVLGIDRDRDLLAAAQREHSGLANLTFQLADILSFSTERQFDIATAARVVQWISSPEAAIAGMIGATRPGGLILILDYNQVNNRWEPDAPAEFKRYYEAFLNWREANGWDNRMAEHLPGLFAAAGLRDIHVDVDDEITTRGDADFAQRSATWLHVIQTVGPQIVSAGFLSSEERADAERVFGDWIQTELRTQILELRTVRGTVPSP